MVQVAPCKINLHLRIGEKQDGGLHGLQSVFALLNFGDSLFFSPKNVVCINASPFEGQTRVTMEMAGPFLEFLSRGRVFEPIPQEKNLVFRAVELFRRKTGWNESVSINIIKRVPPGSGLGGGSSNAAAALLALNTLNSPPGALSRAELMEMAAELGSDVPFFAEAFRPGSECSAAWVSGRGERIKCLPPFPPLGILLVFPGFGSHTKTAFGLLDQVRQDGVPSDFIPEGSHVPYPDNFEEPQAWQNFSNDFLELFLNHGTKEEKKHYTAIFQKLKKTGALFTGLSGSGSACFGVFKSFNDAREAEKHFIGSPYVLQSTFFLRPGNSRITIKKQFGP